ncbi:MAG: GNAT family N-acetyltransferase [Anaerolineales bacterium]|nr:GNAT family N-acetyltransferase [Anaerolineales bacterium]
MDEQEIIIKHIKVKDLYTLAESLIEGALAGKYIPITLHRALAMSKNPYADPDEVGLLAAYHGEECVGYFGIMAIMLQHAGKRSRVHWFTTWSVSPDFLGRGIGSALMAEALTLPYDFMIVGSKPARRVSTKHGFHMFDPLHYTVVDFNVAGRYNLLTLLLRGVRKLVHLFGGKLEIEKASRWGGKVFGRAFTPLLKPLWYALLLGFFKAELDEVVAQRVEQVREPENAPVLDHDRTVFYRGPEAVNWMLRYPWVVEKGQSKSEHLNYYFTDARERFEYVALEISGKSDKAYKGYLVYMLTKVGGRLQLRLLDTHFENPKDQCYALAVALAEARREGADQIEIDDKLAKGLKGGLLGKLLCVPKERIYQCKPVTADSPLGQCWQAIELQYVDGDMSFT